MIETKLTPPVLKFITERHLTDLREWRVAIDEACRHPRARPFTFKRRLRRWWATIRRKPCPIGSRGIAPAVRRGTTAAKWAARWRGRGQVDYRQVAPAYEGCFPLENFVFPHPAFREMGWLQGSFTVPPLFTLDIPYGRTVGRRGAILTPDDFLLTDVSREFFRTPRQHPVFHVPRLPPVRSLKGRYTILNGPGGSTYHWLLDNLARYAVLQAAGYTLDDFDGFLITEPKYAPHQAVIDLMGIPRHKIHWCTRTKHYECEQLVVPSFTNNERQHHPMALDYLHSLIPRPPQPPMGQRRRRIYISRRDCLYARRRTVNEAEVEAILTGYGFECVVLAPLSFMEQARLFAEAEIVVAPHGGGISNICFSDRPFQLVEFFAPDYTPTYFRSMARQLGFGYEALVGEVIGHDITNGADIRVNPDSLRALLDTVLNRSPRSAEATGNV